MNLRIPCFLLAAAAVAANAQSSTQYIAATDATIVTSVEEGYGSTPSAVIYVRNNSTVPVTIYSFALRQCENVQEQCAPTKVDIRLPAGRRSILGHVHPRNSELAFNYRYSFGWRADSVSAQVRGILGPAGSTVPVPPEAQTVVPTQERAPMVTGSLELLDDSALTALGPRLAGLRLSPDSVVLRLGQMFLLGQVKVLAVDADGNVLGRVLAFRWGVVPGVLSVRADTVAGQRVGRGLIDFQLSPRAPQRSRQLSIIVRSDNAN